MFKVAGAFLKASISMALALTAIVGCATNYGAHAVASSGYQYNNAIAQSQDEQLLLNIVRLRYRDTIVFMDVGSVTTQRQYVAGVSAENMLPFKGLKEGSSLLIPGATYSETPTVSYAPLKGSEFARNLLSPISVETIVLLANSGWSIERLLACCVQRLGGLTNGPSASGPTPLELPDNADFREAAKILRKIQRDERVYVEYHVVDGEERAETYLVIDAQGAECSRLETLLSVMDCHMRFRLVERKDEFGPCELSAKTRTVLGALYALSHTVTVPSEHAAAGLVTISEVQSARTADWDEFLAYQFSVKSGRQDPGNVFVKVYYRDHWFWIDDSDLESKTTFSLISFLLSLQSAESDGASPLLTLSAGR